MIVRFKIYRRNKKWSKHIKTVFANYYKNQYIGEVNDQSWMSRIKLRTFISEGLFEQTIISVPNFLISI